MLNFISKLVFSSSLPLFFFLSVFRIWLRSRKSGDNRATPSSEKKKKVFFLVCLCRRLFGLISDALSLSRLRENTQAIETFLKVGFTLSFLPPVRFISSLDVTTRRADHQRSAYRPRDGDRGHTVSKVFSRLASDGERDLKEKPNPKTAGNKNNNFHTGQ